MHAKDKHLAKFSMGFLFILLTFASVQWGASGRGVLDFFEALFKHNNQIYAEQTRFVFLKLRFPHTLAAIICGASLALSGVLSQALFRNPLASPSILGINAGGICAAAIAFLVGMTSSNWLTIPLAAFIGCGAATTILLFFSVRYFSRNSDVLLLAGVALSSLGGAFSALLISLSTEDVQKLSQLTQWILGTLHSYSLELVAFTGAIIVAASFWARRLSYRLNILVLGFDVSENLGVNIRSLQIQCILIIACLEACAISLGGAIAFVGLIIPHLSRILIGPTHRPLMFWSAVNGASLLLASDLVGRTIIQPAEIPVGVIVALIGSPIFFVLLIQKFRNRGGLERS